MISWGNTGDSISRRARRRQKRPIKSASSPQFPGGGGDTASVPSHGLCYGFSLLPVGIGGPDFKPNSGYGTVRGGFLSSFLVRELAPPFGEICGRSSRCQSWRRATREWNHQGRSDVFRGGTQRSRSSGAAETYFQIWVRAAVIWVIKHPPEKLTPCKTILI